MEIGGVIHILKLSWFSCTVKPSELFFFEFVCVNGFEAIVFWGNMAFNILTVDSRT